MNIVLYTTDFEPITVLDLSMDFLMVLEAGQRVRLPVEEAFDFPLVPATAPPSRYRQPRDVSVWAQQLLWIDGTRKMVLLTDNDELALLLRPDWLPGQRGQINDYESRIASFTYFLTQALAARE